MRNAFTVASPRVTALRALNYTPEVESFRAKADSQTCRRFGDLLSSLGPAYGSVFTRIDCQPEFGVELMAQSDMFATEPAGRFIRRDCLPRPEAHKVHKWQVLIAGAGTLGENELYGRSVIADDRLEGRYVGPDAMVMTFDDPGSPESLYAYAFLCTKVGVRCVRATSYGTKVLRLRSEMLANLPIPFPSDDLINQVSALIATTVLKRGSYFEFILKARKVIERIHEVSVANEMLGDRKARCVVYEGKSLPTLSAWNFASTGGALEYLRRQWSGRLGDVVRRDRLSYGARFSRVPCQPPYGVDFWSQRDIFLIRAIPRRIRKPNFDDDLLFVPDDAILVSGRGQLQEGNLFGRADLAVFGASSAIITGDAIPLIPHEGYSDLLYTFLSTKLGLQLLRTCAIGTSIPAMHLGILSDLPIPDVGNEELTEITGHLKAAVKARIAAAEAEAEAIRIIEEEVLPEWLA